MRHRSIPSAPQPILPPPKQSFAPPSRVYKLAIRNTGAPLFDSFFSWNFEFLTFCLSNPAIDLQNAARQTSRCAIVTKICRKIACYIYLFVLLRPKVLRFHQYLVWRAQDFAPLRGVGNCIRRNRLTTKLREPPLPEGQRTGA